MVKTKEELNELKKELELLNSKLEELSEDELKQVTGGVNRDLDVKPDGSSVGTTADENIPPSDINHRN